MLLRAAISLSLAVAASVSAANFNAEALLSCAQVQSEQQRLDCFDTVVLRMRQSQSSGSDNSIDAKTTLIADPSSTLLASKLRVDRNQDDFDLTVAQFLDLIKVAVLDEGSPIEILGWQRVDKQQYTLWLDLRGRTGLVFQLYPQTGSAISVLQSVTMQNRLVDPGMFIMNIAAMGPDE